VAASASKGTVGFPSQLRLSGCDRLDLDACFAQKLIEATAKCGAAIAVYYNG